jgi:hypothetical protein
MTRNEMLIETKRLAVRHQSDAAEWQRIACAHLQSGDLHGTHTARWHGKQSSEQARNYLDCVLSGKPADGVFYGYAYGFNGHADRA